MTQYIFWPSTIILFFAFAFAFLFLMPRRRHKRLVFCGWLFGISIGGGFLFYSYCYLSTGTGFADILYAALRGIYSTARMFIISDDFSALARVTDNMFLQVLFWISHVVAIVALHAALISLFAWKLIDYGRLRFGLHSEVYIIKGCDRKAVILGENIATKDNPNSGKRIRNRLIVFLLDEEDDLKKTYEKVSCFGGVVQVMDRRKNISHFLDKAGLGRRILRRKNYHVIMLQDRATQGADLFEVLKYANNKKVRPEQLNIYVSALTEWERGVIEDITQLVDKEGRREYPYTFHIVNETDLLIRQLIDKHPPYKCSELKFTEKGVAARDFTVLVLGFGSVGQKALLRLVMNGQFVGSRMQAKVIDREMNHLEEHFLHYYPYVKPNCCDIEFLCFDVWDKDFYQLLEKNHNFDYVVVALGNDSQNKQLAIDIRLHYERHYCALPNIAVLEKLQCQHEAVQDSKLFAFGCRESLYTEATIIREKHDTMAIAVNNTYKNMYDGKPWHELDWFTQESNRASADFIPAMLKLAKLKTEGAMIKESLTEDAELIEILAETEHLRWNAFHATMGYNQISIEKMSRRFESYLGERYSREHLDYCRRDTKSLLHSCLISWDDLDGVSAAYRELARKAGNEKEQKRNFKDNDRAIVMNIPKFLRALNGIRL